LGAFGYTFGPWFLIVGAVVAVGYFRWKGSGVEMHSLPSSEQSKLFYPFIEQTNAEQRKTIILNIEEIGARLRRAIEGEQSRHVVVVGDSGVGKSVLLQEFVFSPHDTVYYVNEYDQLSVENLIRRILTEANAKSDQFLDIEAHMRMIGDMSSGEKGVETVEIEKILSGISKTRSAENLVYVVFDQAERILANLFREGGEERYTDFKIFSGVVGALRKLDCVRSVFLIRSEYAVQTLGAIASMEGVDAYSGLDEIVRYYYYEGLNLRDEDGAYNALKTRFSKLGTKGSGTEILSSMTNKGQYFLNAFDVQLVGYMGEAFYGKDEWITKTFDSLKVDENIVRDRFWYYLREEFNRIAGNHDAEKALFVVLYTISAYNSCHGAPLSLAQIAILSGLATDDVEEAVKFLLDKGVLCRVDKRVHQEEVRLVHDVLRDYFLTTAYPKIRNAYRDAIRMQIKQNRVALPHWNAPKRSWFVDDILVLKSYIKKPHFLVIVLMMLVCLARLLAPEYISPFYQNAADRWDWMAPWVQTNANDQIVYAPKMFAQFLWVTFMYNFYENFFRDYLGGGKTWTRRIAISAAPIGAILGGITAFSPALFLIPIAAGGAMLAATYVMSARKGYLDGLASQMASELGYKTGGNMLFSVGLTGILMVLYFYPGTQTYAELVSIFIAASFIYFYFLMKPRQNSAEGWGEFIVSGRIPTTH